ncbi:MAG TPA: CUAEP/CCAEP-tail radical SAM protein, partial [Vicinamibacterales bacterium]|nr:CUAEP/CCAEP-tail radical SAM protein [Vicinamibacterales bacterium]
LELPDVRVVTEGFDQTSLTYPWTHSDPSVDALQKVLTDVVAGRLMAPRRQMFASIWEAAHQHAGVAAPPRQDSALRKGVIPALSEPWFCCAEPTAEQLALM